MVGLGIGWYLKKFKGMSHQGQGRLGLGCKVLDCQLSEQTLRSCTVVHSELGLNLKQLGLQCKPLYPAMLFYISYNGGFS